MLRKEHRLALIVARQYVVALSSQYRRVSSGLSLTRWLEIARQLTNAESIPCVLKAAALDLIAEYAELSGISAESRDAHEQDAIRLYRQEGHANGAANISIRQLSRNCATGRGSIEDNVNAVLKHLATFEEQGYVWGIHRGLQELQASLSDTRYFDFQLMLIQMTKEVAEMSKARMFSLLIQLKSIAAWLAHSGRAARVIEASVPLYESISENDARTLKGHLSHIISQAYLQLEDFDTAMSWSNQSLALFPPLSHESANATTLELRISLLKASFTMESDLDSFLEKWDGVIEQDLKDGAIDAAVEKLDGLTTQLIRMKDAREALYLGRIESLIPLLSGSSATLADKKLAAFYQNSAVSAVSQIAPLQPDTEFEESAIGLLEKSVPLYMKHGALAEAGNCRQLQALAHYSVFRKSHSPARLRTALELASIALACFRGLDITGMISLAAYWSAFYTYVAWEYRLVTADASLRQLRVAEEAKNEERMDLLILGGLSALSRKQKMRGETKTQEIYDMARRICIREGLKQDLWQWTQRSKARSLSDLLGLGTLIPEPLRRDIEENPATRALFQEEERLQESIKAAENGERIQLRNQLHLLHGQMGEHATLRALMDLRAGNPISLPNANDLVTQVHQESPGTNVTFVDWVFVDGDIFIISVRNHDQPRVSSCIMSEDMLRKWNEIYAKGEGQAGEGIYTSDLEEDDPAYCLRQLDPLVAPISALSEEDDLLVFCATGPLHSIPLHALWIDDEPLILRNPVVYCASLTSAWQCWRRALGSGSTMAQQKRLRTIMAVYNDEADARFSSSEQARIYASADSLSVQIDADPLVGEKATVANFGESIRQSTLFHFHGHCVLNPENLVEQSILLADGSVSVLDVFKLQFNTTPHITLIACDSATQSNSSNGDEPLGLIAGLLCAGASSVLGTMWPISSATGREFSERFYSELDHAHAMDADAPDATSLVNLAVNLQAAVIEIRGEARTRRHFHWAPFVLHGSPFMRLG